MSEEKKQKLKEYEKKNREARIKRPKTFYYLLPLIILYVLFFNKLFFIINVRFIIINIIINIFIPVKKNQFRDTCQGNCFFYNQKF